MPQRKACFRGFPALLTALLLIVTSRSGRATTFTVTSTGDSGNPGTLRWAITNANSTPGTDTIAFAISGSLPFNIVPNSALPPITDPVIIDGTTQSGFAGHPVIVIKGGSAGNTSDGLRISAGNSTVQGLAIANFKRDGIRIETNGDCIIQGNYLGTDSTGQNALGNQEGGVLILHSANNLIGGTNAQQQNVMADNFAGVYIQDPTSTNNQISGNFIGTDNTGLSALGNQSYGVLLEGVPGNIVGGNITSNQNVISGNKLFGVYIYMVTAFSNSVVNNIIGLKADGSGAIGNVMGGVTISGSAANFIGSNVISGNLGRGIDLNFLGAGANSNVIQANFIGTDPTGEIARPNRTNGIAISMSSGNLIGGANPAARNIIAANGSSGIFITSNAMNNTVSGNFIGVDATGTVALGNGFNGIDINSGSGNVIGGASAGMRNIISGNTNSGVYLESGTAADFVQGNFIGTDVTGAHSVSNLFAGVRIECPSNTIGGAIGSSGNLISGNASSGVLINGTGATGNLVAGNLVGTDATGSNALGNVFTGVAITNAPQNIVGGTALSARNILSANGINGIYMQGPGAVQNQVLGNYIGTDISGMNGVGNVEDGLVVANIATNNIIGGATAGAGNLISANGTLGNLSGILITNVSGTVVQGNTIGTKIDGVSPLGNTSHGVEIYIGDSNIVGGVAAGAGNKIAYAPTLRSGVRIRNPVPGASVGNLISGNSIFANANLGIDLEPVGVNNNVACNAGTANNANRGQNYPVLTLAASDALSVGVKGTLNSTTSTTFQIQFFASPTCNGNGFGQGSVFLGQGAVITDGSCNASFTATINKPVAPGQVITATATDPAGNTSEFSACVPVAAAPTLTSTFAIPPAVANPQLTLSWPVASPGFALQQTASLTPPVVWSNVTNAVTISNSLNVVTVPVPGNTQFFRLSFQ